MREGITVDGGHAIADIDFRESAAVNEGSKADGGHAVSNGDGGDGIFQTVRVISVGVGLYPRGKVVTVIVAIVRHVKVGLAANSTVIGVLADGQRAHLVAARAYIGYCPDQVLAVVYIALATVAAGQGEAVEAGTDGHVVRGHGERGEATVGILMRAIRTAEIVVVIERSAGEGVCNALVVRAEFTGVVHVDLVVGTIYIVRCSHLALSAGICRDGEVGIGGGKRRTAQGADTDVSAGRRDQIAVDGPQCLAADVAERVTVRAGSAADDGGCLVSRNIMVEELVVWVFLRLISDEPLPFGGTQLSFFATKTFGIDIVIGITPAEDDISVATNDTCAAWASGCELPPIESEVSDAIYTHI